MKRGSYETQNPDVDGERLAQDAPETLRASANLCVKQ